ncbi:uncharacterized protein LOC124650535 isoform X2 [Lolium rigidum]|uniref:uncharacterized protein LOC124650535 isoform X2 n=1 Tax=Lolium rigidum TaxID=89674 RepID=UPI001F5DB323|nr:uncharacterized protein LOC124650535 isoform X2 [Lolium rigidum]
MADHFAVMAGRLLTASTVQSAIDNASDAPSSTAAASACVEEAVLVGKQKSGVLVECRICQDEDDETCMEAPCSCKGSLKYAHRTCVQRWCDEKGDTICEICLQQFAPNYTAPSKLFHHGRNSIFFRTPAYIQAQDTYQSSSTSTSYEYDRQASTPKSVICCRIIAITLMLLLVLHDAISVFLSDHDVYTVAMITLLMLRTAAVVIPLYIIMVAVTELLYRRNQLQSMQGQVSEAAGRSTQPVPVPPPQQLVVISIQ